MGMLVEGFNGLVEMERLYNGTEEGRELISGVVSDVLDLIPWPFRVEFIGLELDRPKMVTFVDAIRARIRTYLAGPIPNQI